MTEKFSECGLDVVKSYVSCVAEKVSSQYGVLVIGMPLRRISRHGGSLVIYVPKEYAVKLRSGATYTVVLEPIDKLTEEFIEVKARFRMEGNRAFLILSRRSLGKELNVPVNVYVIVEGEEDEHDP